MSFTIKSFILILISYNLFGCTGFYNCSKLQDNPSAFQQCQAKNGDDEAQYQLGRQAYENGDIKTALKWLRKAAHDTQETMITFDKEGRVRSNITGKVIRGHYDARMLLAHIYENGIGVPVNVKRANWYR